MKFHPISHAIFETTKSGFIQILHHRSVSWKIRSLYFFSSNLIQFGQKKSIKIKFSYFWVVGWKSTKFLMSYLKPQVSSSLNLASLFSVMRDNSSVHFRVKLWMTWKKEAHQSATFQKFHCTLIGFFCWKYIKFQLVSRDTEESWKIWRKTDLLFKKW